MKKTRILLIEDDPIFIRLVLAVLSKRDDYLVSTASTLEEAKTALQGSYDAVILDYYLDVPNTALDVLPLIDAPTLLFTAKDAKSLSGICKTHGNIAEILSKRSSVGYLEKLPLLIDNTVFQHEVNEMSGSFDIDFTTPAKKTRPKRQCRIDSTMHPLLKHC